MTNGENDGEVIAEDIGKDFTERLIVIDNVFYHAESGCKTRKITQSEARRYMRDWGYAPSTVVCRHEE